MESAPKNKGKKSLFMCFKPTLGVHDSLAKSQKHNHHPNDPVLAYLAVANEDGVVLSSSFTEKDCRKKKGRDRWRSLRTALIGTSLMKKIVNKKKTNKDNPSLSRSNSNLEGEEVNDKNISKSKLKSIKRTDSNISSTFGFSSAFPSSSSLSSNSSSSRSDHVSGLSSKEIHSPSSVSSKANMVTTKTKHNGVGEQRKGKYYSSNVVLCMLSITSLLVLIIWGKFLAIMYTSILFCVLPFRKRMLCHVAFLRGKNEFDWIQHKKKVIMEGLIHRSHSRVSQANSSLKS